MMNDFTTPANRGLRLITQHRTDLCNERICIRADDDTITPGGAPSVYYLSVEVPEGRKILGFQQDATTKLTFHQGDPKNGTTGLTHEALLAVLTDRLEAFQDGPFPSEWNDIALFHLRRARAALNERAQGRRERGVEGKLEP